VIEERQLPNLFRLARDLHPFLSGRLENAQGPNNNSPGHQKGV
jgi:hypothetical protein